MARIIRQFAEVQLTCFRCGSNVGFEVTDATMDDAHGEVYVTCPVCKAHLKIHPPVEWLQVLD